jgi:hypothetical protein
MRDTCQRQRRPSLEHPPQLPDELRFRLGDLRPAQQRQHAAADLALQVVRTGEGQHTPVAVVEALPQ